MQTAYTPHPGTDFDPGSPLFVVKALLILDSDGERIAAKYYHPNWKSTFETQRAFEKALWAKTQVHAGIMLYEDSVAVFKNAPDANFYVIGGVDENELILASVLQTFYDAVSVLLRHQVEKRSLFENLDFVFLALDEVIDGGIILESESELVVDRVSLRGIENPTEAGPINEQNIADVLARARDIFLG